MCDGKMIEGGRKKGGMEEGRVGGKEGERRKRRMTEGRKEGKLRERWSKGHGCVYFSSVYVFLPSFLLFHFFISFSPTS